MLALQILGTLSLRDDTDAVPLSVQQKRRLGFLGILALAGRQGLARERIEAYLWPESSATLARHSLDQTVYAIRNALAADLILCTGRELRLNPKLVDADVWEFEDAILVGDWARAVEHYNGALLEGIHLADSGGLESWIDINRTRLRGEYENAIEQLANLSAATGDHSQSVIWCSRLATSDPLSPSAAKQLMAALAAAGDRAGAVKHARLYQALVRQELEMEPDSEIEDLASTFRNPASAEMVGAVAALSEPIVAPFSAVAESRPIPIESAGGETEVRTSRDRPLRTMHSLRAALLTFSALFALLIGAVLVENGKARSPQSAAPAIATISPVPVPAARSSLLRGLKAWNEGSPQGVDTAVIYFRRATELDPDYAEAYAALSTAYAGLGYYGYRPAEAMFRKSKAAALRSIQLDSTLASSQGALAFELIWERDFVYAESQARKAIALKPTDALAHQGYALLLMILGRRSEALAESRKAAALDPFSLIIQGTYGSFLNSSGEHLAALQHFQKTFGEEPDAAWVRRNPWPFDNMARVYADNGRYAEAFQTIDRALTIVPRHPRVLYSLALIYDMTGRRDMAHQTFARADAASEYYTAYRGMLYGAEGNVDSAFVWFKRVDRWGILALVALQSDPHLNTVRNDPRYTELLQRIDIAPRERSEPQTPR